jgi:proteasome lid subunit RPN8/RPN11
VLTDPVGRDRLRLPRAVYDQMLGHAAEALPAEAVGLLGGVGHQVCRHIALPNVLGGKSFLADPYAQFKALRQLAAEGLEPVAVYHSHPGGGVGLSSADMTFARRLPYLQIVIALARPHRATVDVAAYVLRGDVAESVEVDVVEDRRFEDDATSCEGDVGGSACRQPGDERRSSSR